MTNVVNFAMERGQRQSIEKLRRVVSTMCKDVLLPVMEGMGEGVYYEEEKFSGSSDLVWSFSFYVSRKLARVFTVQWSSDRGQAVCTDHKVLTGGYTERSYDEVMAAFYARRKLVLSVEQTDILAREIGETA